MSKLIIFLIALTTFSCGEVEKDKENSEKAVFRYNSSAGINSLDPAFCRNTENIWAVNQMFNGLVQMDSNMKVKPSIAKRWEISEDGKIYTFYLRDDVYFHDHEVFPDGEGRKVIAEDFVHSFFRIMDQATASPGSYIFSNLDNGRENNKLGLEAINDTTLKIHLKEPFPPFLGLLTMKYCSVVPHEVVEHYDKDFRNNPVGTGPFKFKMWKEGVKLVMVKNEDYFEKDDQGVQLPYLDAVSVSFVNDRSSAFLDFTKGKYDMLSDPQGSTKDEVLTSQGKLDKPFSEEFYMQKQPYLKTDYLGILVDDELEQVKQSPLNKRLLRQAINYAIDRQNMVSNLENNIGRPATSGFVPYGMPSFDADKVKGYEYNPEKARELLFEAGYPKGEGLPQISLTTTANYIDLCEYIQHQLAEVNIDVKIDVLPAANHREYVAQSRVNFFRKSWIADYADAENFLALFYSKNFSPTGPNYTHFKNRNFDKLYEKAMHEVRDSVRYEYYTKMDSIVMDHAPVVPLYYDEVVRFVQNNIDGLESNPMNLLVLKRVKKN